MRNDFFNNVKQQSKYQYGSVYLTWHRPTPSVALNQAQALLGKTPQNTPNTQIQFVLFFLQVWAACVKCEHSALQICTTYNFFGEEKNPYLPAITQAVYSTYGLLQEERAVLLYMEQNLSDCITDMTLLNYLWWIDRGFQMAGGAVCIVFHHQS